MSIEHGPRYSRKAEAVLIPWRLRVSVVYQQYCKEMDNKNNLDIHCSNKGLGIGPVYWERVRAGD